MDARVGGCLRVSVIKLAFKELFSELSAYFFQLCIFLAHGCVWALCVFSVR